MRSKCENCGSPVETSVKGFLTSLTDLRLCDECKSINLPKSNSSNWDDLEIAGNIPEEDFPEEIKEEILQKLRDEGVDPSDAKLIAIRHDLLDPDGFGGVMDSLPDEALKKLRILKARHDFLTCAKSFMMTLHDLSHADISRDELEVLVKRFTSMEHEIVTDYLFYGEDDLPSYQDLEDRGMRTVFECDSDK